MFSEFSELYDEPSELFFLLNLVLSQPAADMQIEAHRIMLMMFFNFFKKSLLIV